MYTKNMNIDKIALEIRGNDRVIETIDLVESEISATTEYFRTFYSDLCANVKEKWEVYKNIKVDNKIVRLLHSQIKESANEIYYKNITEGMTIFEKLGNYKSNAYMGKCWGEFAKLYEFEKCCKYVKDMEYSVTVDKSLTRKKFEENIENVDILYTYCHAYLKTLNTPITSYEGKLVAFSDEKEFSGKDYISYRSFMGKQTNFKLVFFNVCLTGTEYFTKYFPNHMNTEVYIGWKYEVASIDAALFAERFFELLNERNVKENRYYNVREALLIAHNQLFGTDLEKISDSTLIYADGKLDIVLRED